MMVEKNSNGDYICKICWKPHTSLQQATDCVDSHKPDKIPGIPEKSEPGNIISDNANSSIASYKYDVSTEGTIKAAERLMVSLIEDYVISRDRDLAEKGRVGALTLNLGKLASEAMNGYNKIIYGTKSSSVNVNLTPDSKKSDIDALAEVLKGREKTIDGEPITDKPK